MIAALIVAALAAPVDEERALLHLEQGEAVEALADARVGIADGGWRAWRVYAQALDAAGLGHRVRAELQGAAARDGDVAVVLAWHDASGEGRRAAGMASLAEARERADEVGRLALASLSLDGGNAQVAATVADGGALAETRGVALAAAVALADDRAAAALAGALLRDIPARPDLLAALFTGGEARRGLRAARRDAVAAAERLAARSEDPVALYRARRLLLAAGEDEAVAAAVERLAALGEPDVPSRGPYGAAMRRGLVRGLSMQRDPALPEGPWLEVRDVGVGVALALRDMGRVREALAVWEALRARRDDTELAVAHARQLLRAGRADEAVAVADDAIALAAAPRDDDVDRSAERAWRHELAMAHALAAEARLAAERPDEALSHAVLAAALAPGAEHLALRASAHAALGQEEAAFTALAVSHALGGVPASALEATYPGSGHWADAARDAAARWSAETGAELPVRDAGDLPERPDRPIAGAPFPAWSAGEGTDAIGGEALLGRVVVVQFWASWCAPCRRELPEVDGLAAAWRADGLPVEVIALSLDDEARAMLRATARLELVHTAVRWAPQVGERLGISSLPTTWVVDREGIARHFHQGYGPGAARRLDDEVRALAGR